MGLVEGFVSLGFLCAWLEASLGVLWAWLRASFLWGFFGLGLELRFFRVSLGLA